MTVNRRDIGSIIFVLIALAGVIGQYYHYCWQYIEYLNYPHAYAAVTLFASCVGMIWTLWGKTKITYLTLALCIIPITSVLVFRYLPEQVAEEMIEGPFFHLYALPILIFIPAAGGISAIYGIWSNIKEKDGIRISTLTLCAYFLLIVAGFYLLFTGSICAEVPPDIIDKSSMR